jgi:hypothetical protein
VTRAQHYAEAERLAAKAIGAQSLTDTGNWAALAQVHATLAAAPEGVAEEAQWITHRGGVQPPTQPGGETPP